MQNLNNSPLALTFDDVSLVPVRSTVKSRKEPNVSTVVGEVHLKVPIIASPMNTISEVSMAEEMSYLGGGCVVHRYMSVDQQADIFKCLASVNAIEPRVGVWAAIGATGDYLERARMLYNVGVKYFCVDVANGHSQTLLDAVESIKKAFPDVSVMA